MYLLYAIIEFIVWITVKIIKASVRSLGPKLSAALAVAAALILLLSIMSQPRVRPVPQTSITTTIVPFPTKIPSRTSGNSRPAVAVKPDQSAKNVTRLVVEETLPSEANLTCLAYIGMIKTTIAVNYSTDARSQGIALIGQDSKRLCHLTKNTDGQNIHDDEPHWLLDGRIAFNSTRGKNLPGWQSDVYFVTTGFSLLRTRLSSGMMVHQPAWSSDGKRIAFIADDGFGNNYEVYVVNADGTNLSRLTAGALVSWLAWSSDDKSIFFTGSDANRSQLYKIDINGLKPINLSPAAITDWAFALSPDGTSLAAISSASQDNRELYVMNIDGTNRRLLVSGEVENLILRGTAPAWLADNKTILFIAEDSAYKSRLYKVNLDGSGLMQFYQGDEEITSVATQH